MGRDLSGPAVVSPRESLICDPDCVCLCVLDDGRALEMEAQLSQLGYDGELLRPDALGVFDARAATMRLLAEQIHGLQVPATWPSWAYTEATSRYS